MIHRLAAGCVLLTGSVLMAQNASEIQDVETRWVAVTTPAASLHCGDLTNYYSVGELATGTILQLNGENESWARVVYPKGVYPFVLASEANDLGNDRVALTAPSQLRAPSRLMGVSGSWRSVYRTALPIGTEFEIMGRETNPDGDVTAYAVKPIHGETLSTLPNGFIRTSAFRDATDTEIQAHLASVGQPQTTPVSTEQAPESPPATEPGDAELPADDDVDTSLLDPINTTPPSEQDDSATDDSPAEQAEGESPEVIEQNEVGTVEDDDAYADEYGIRPARLIELEDAFKAARVLSREDLDGALEELLAEYLRAYEATDEVTVQRSLQSRIDWLKIRMDSRDTRLDLNAFLNKADDTRQKNTSLVEQWQAGQAFDFVGRVLVSRVYDGKRLPKMYRLVGDDPITGARTLGYLPESEEFDAGPFVGQIIGVRGQLDQNPDSRLRVIRVDTMSVMPEE